MDVQDTNIFTGIPEIDTHTLHQLDSETLYQICQVNSYAYELCTNDKVLKNKIRNYLMYKNRNTGSLKIGVLEHDVLLSHNDDNFRRRRDF